MKYTFNVKEYNQGYKAGRKSGMFNLGGVNEPIRIGPGNILDLFVDMEGVSEEDRDWSGISKPTVLHYLFRYEFDEHTERRIVMARIIPATP